MELEKETKITVAIESTKDYTDRKIGFYTYDYPNGRDGTRYRLVSIGDDGKLSAYPNENKWFINREHIQEYIDAYADQLNVISYDDMVYQAGEKQAVLQAEKKYRIALDIEQSGLKATGKLIHNISSFEQMEGREYSMKDLRILMESEPDFSNYPDKKLCFKEIVSECKMQESEQILEERYKEAMQMLGYEQTADNVFAQDGFLVFENKVSAETRILDGWQAVGEYLEEVQLPAGVDQQYFDSLIHPEGRLEYYTNLPEAEVPVEVHKSFEEAYAAYNQAEIMDGKSLGFTLNGRTLDLIWFDSRSMEHNLFRASKLPESYAPECTVNELRELKTNTREMVGSLQKENAYIQMLQATDDMMCRAFLDIDRGNEKGVWETRVASDRRPQDYMRFVIDQSETQLQMRTSIIHANEIVQENGWTVNTEDVRQNGTKAFLNEEYPKWLHQQVMDMDTDYMPMGLKSFTTYADHSFCSLEDHYEKLEVAGYEKQPSYALAFEMAHPDIKCESMHPAEIEKDIVRSGFKASPQLIKNIHRFEQMEGRQYSLKELAELKRSNPNFSNQPDKKACFEAIVAECQAQETGHGQNMEAQRASFIKQEMIMEQMQVTPM